MDSFIIGASDSVTEGEWRYPDGTLLEYTNWNTGEPNNANGIEHHVLVSTSASGAWNDIMGSRLEHPMCQAGMYVIFVAEQQTGRDTNHSLLGPVS